MPKAKFLNDLAHSARKWSNGRGYGVLAAKTLFSSAGRHAVKHGRRVAKRAMKKAIKGAAKKFAEKSRSLFENRTSNESTERHTKKTSRYRNGGSFLKRSKYGGKGKGISGPRCTIQFWQQYYVTGGDLLNPQGMLYCDANQQANMFIPILEDRQLNGEIRVGESTATTGTVGYFDPPPTQGYIAGVKSVYGVDLITKDEVFDIEKLKLKFYFSNTGDTKCHLEITEWICNMDSDQSLPSRAKFIYNAQQNQSSAQIPGEPQSGAISGIDMFNVLGFDVNRLANFKKYWKKGIVREVVQFEPGDVKEIAIDYNNLVWDQAKYKNMDNGSVATCYYHKNLSRVFQVKIRGGVGYDSAALPIAAFQKCSIGYVCSKELTGKRRNTFGLATKQYCVNLGSYTTTMSGYGSVPEYLPVPTVPVLNYEENLTAYS